jgi:hypothetical protein
MTADVPRALYTGTTHDDDFSSIDSGKTWNSATGACGDCDAWIGDLYQRKRVVRVDPRYDDNKGMFSVFENTANAPPDASSTSPTEVKYPPGARLLTLSTNVIKGSRHAIQTLPGNTPPAKGDYLVIVERSGVRKLMRANDSLDGSATDSGFTQVEPDLPATVSIVQASGGHADPVFFLGDELSSSIWRGDKDNSGKLQWNQIVPSATAPRARRFFVDPWQPEILYLIDDVALRRSVDGGDTWSVDQELTDAVSGMGKWRFGCNDIDCLLNDMAFDPTHPTRRFAAGAAGVFYTAGGTRWTRLLDTRALPSRPLSLWFDPLTDPAKHALIVGTMGRGALILSPIPDQDPVRPVEWVAIPKTASAPLRRWMKIGAGHQLTWTPAGAGTTRRPSPQDAEQMGRSRILVLGDADASGVAAIPVACDEAEKRIVFNWRAFHAGNREVPAALNVRLVDEDGGKALALTLGAEQSNGSWHSEALELAPGRCGVARVEFSARFDPNRPSRFEIGGLSLERLMNDPLAR